MNWTHDGLQADLASHLAATRDRIIWEDMQLGPAASPRPDVFTIPKSYSKFRPLAYEIKISVADFRRDVTAGKWQKYLEFACGVTFAVPAGLVTKADVPHGCGLMVRGDDGWRTIKAPTLRLVPTLPHDAWMKLVIDGISRQQRNERRQFNEWAAEKKLADKFGEEAARIIRKLGSPNQIQYELEQLKVTNDMLLAQERKRYLDERNKLNRDRIQVDAEMALIVEMLGLPPESGAWDVAYALKEARSRLNRDEEIARLQGVIKSVSRVVKGAELEVDEL